MAQGDTEARDQGSPWKWVGARLSVDLNGSWPMLKYMAFGFYYAWIWLMYSSSVMVPANGASSIVYDSYISSTTVLALCLAAAAIFYRKVAPLLLRPVFLVAASLVSVAGTLMVGFAASAGPVVLVAANAMTAAGTSVLVLRLGQLYSTVGLRESLMAAAASFVAACALFFIGIGLGRVFGVVFAALLPLIGSLLLLLDGESGSLEASGAYRGGLVDPAARSLFVRLIAGIFLISFAIGVARGYLAFSEVAGDMAPGAVMAFGTGAASVILVLVIGSTSRSINLSKVYSPVLLTVVGCFVLLSLISGDSPVIVDVLGVGYALIGLIVWCLFSAVSHANSLAPVIVFGWGRCAWGAAATLGWLSGKLLFEVAAADRDTFTVAMVCLGFLVVVIGMLVLGERHIEGMLTLAPAPPETAAREGVGSWKRRCAEVAQAHGLSPRETEVLVLLAKGRTIEYIADECGVSVNTSKAHVRHVYVKLDVHSRQELLDLIESF